MANTVTTISRHSSKLYVPVLAFVLVCALVIGCSTRLNRPTPGINVPIVRVRVQVGIEQLTVIASEQPVYRTETDPTARKLGLPKNTPVNIILTATGWKIGSTVLGTGTLTLQPTADGSMAIAPTPMAGDKPQQTRAYRGQYRLVPTGPTKFDVVNDVDVDGYLAGVLRRELLPTWHIETYKAQAIIARTYALYEKAKAPINRHFDVNADESSQVYGGILDETDNSREAVNYTRGVVVVHGPEGQTPHIFKAYFSACCGGISQSGGDAFAENIEPLAAKDNRGICNASPRFSWGPLEIEKSELTRRIKGWGQNRNHAIKDMMPLKEVLVQGVNEYGRPNRFALADTRGTLYSLSAEEFRTACNHSAASSPTLPKGKPPVILYSSFVKIINDSDKIRFVEGHGWGHGVGMCQWCSQRRAEEGMRHEDIVLAAYPKAVLAKGY